MSHSTHVGFSFPPAWVANGGVFRANSDGAVPVSFQSRAAGIGRFAQRRHPGCFIIEGASWFAVAVGVANRPSLALVGSIATTIPRSTFLPRLNSFSAPSLVLLPFDPSVAFGVGSKQPPPLAEVRCANI